MSAAMPATAAMESAATVESAATAKVGSATAATGKPATVTNVSTPASVESTTAVVSASAVITASAPIAATITAPAPKPRAGANEDAAHEIVRAVISVRGASVRGVPVIAVGTHWSRAVISTNRAYPNTDGHLRVRETRCKQTNTQ